MIDFNFVYITFAENQDQLNAKLTEIIEEELQKKNAANGNEGNLE